ncbi:hypothetical protein SAY87_031801 [Trapa incisa]|uniref:Non-specific lipid-transfer protein n=2 Tax=Trapa TaxID=22665 RepID=A0AAN7M3A6_TRANT|nr:hypothetical protein SAY87_031801 [Trapa incisa]KAK4796844.1 hypothetical protein SAY86_029170 [Trapa natans]
MARFFSTAVAVIALMACLFMVAESTMTCGQVASGVAPCLGYLRNVGPLTPTCCASIRSLNNAARSTDDRQSVCKCLKAAATSIKGISLPVAGSLPSKCGITIPYKISPSTDCSTVR